MRRLITILGAVIAGGTAIAGTPSPNQAFTAELKFGYIATDLLQDYGFWMIAIECKQPLPTKLKSFLNTRIRESEAKLPNESHEMAWGKAWSTRQPAGIANCSAISQVLERDYGRHFAFKSQGQSIPPKPDF